MRKLMLAASAALATCTIVGLAYAQATTDPIAVRKSIMQSNRMNAGAVEDMLAAGATFDQAAAVAALTTISGNLQRFPMLFPDGTQTGGDPPTRALPDIWSNMETFQALAAELSSQAANAANVAASGDAAALQTAFADARAVCDTCHESFRGPAPQ